jgi:hypothetical protein
VRLDLVWDSATGGGGSASAASAGSVAVLFDRPDAGGREGTVAADELLTWESRVDVETGAAETIAALRAHPQAAALSVDGFSLLEFAEYDLRFEWLNVMRGFEVGVRAGERWDVDEVVAQPGCPTSIVAGVRAGAGLPQAVGTEPWRGIAEHSTEGALRPRVGDALLRAVEKTRRLGSVRIMAVPAGTVGPALLATPHADLRAAGLGVMTFPGLDQGLSARLAPRLRLPGLAGLSSGVRARGAEASPKLPAGIELHGDRLLDAALRAVGDRVLTDNAHLATRAAATARRLDRLSGLRCLLLPTSALGPSRLLIEWARSRGVRVAVVQHGFYAFREADGGDRRAGTVFAWGGGVADQVARWPEPRPEVVVSGAPGAPKHLSPPLAVTAQRVLVATTNAPLGSAFGLFGFCEAFLRAVGPGVARLQSAGVSVELRLHPRESRVAYERMLARLGIDMPFAPDEPFGEAARRYDMLVSSTSSVAFEAGALGMPVLLWDGSVPMDVYRDHYLPPWDEDAPVRFSDAAEFDRLAGAVLADPQSVLADAMAYGRRLAEFVEPFSAERFADGLRRLAL